jgi:Protein phosphatase 2C
MNPAPRRDSVDRPAGKRRSSWLRRLFGWLWSDNGTQDEAVRATDAYFASVGGGRPRVLGSSSGLPKSPLAAAYAAAPAATPLSEAPSPPQWKVLEPADGSDPTIHREWLAARPQNSWGLLAASVRGRLHAHQALWRDDAFAWDRIEDWTCIAVADGAGSARLSRVGARLACDEGVRALTAALKGWRPSAGEDGEPSQDDLRRLRTALADAARQALARIAAEAERRGCALRDFHTTYLLLAHVPFADADLLAALQVGDGAIGAYTGPGSCRVLGDADHGAFASETQFLTTLGTENELERRIVFALPRGLQAVALMTDGVADDFFPESKRLVELMDGDPIPDLKSAQCGPVRGLLHSVLADPREGEALAEWLQYEKRGSSDDRTLVLLHRVPHAGTVDTEPTCPNGVPIREDEAVVASPPPLRQEALPPEAGRQPPSESSP